MLPFITINIIDINVFLFGLIQIFASLAHQFHHQNWDQSQLTKVVGSSALLLVRVVLLDHSEKQPLLLVSQIQIFKQKSMK